MNRLSKDWKKTRLIDVGESSICDECDREACEGFPSENNKCFAKRWIDEQPTVDVVPCEFEEKCFKKIEKKWTSFLKNLLQYRRDGKRDGMDQVRR